MEGRPIDIVTTGAASVLHRLSKGDGGINYHMFEDWKIKFEAQKKSRTALGDEEDENRGADDDDDASSVGAGTAGVGGP